MVAQLCRKLPSTDELAKFWEKIHMEECIQQLKREFPEDDDISNYVNKLNDLKELIVVFDAIEHHGDLSGAIADAMRKGVIYRVEKYDKLFSPDVRARELEWCLVRFHFSQ